MNDNINPYTGEPSSPYGTEPANPYGTEPVNPYDQQPSYAQDIPDADPYTQDSFNTDSLIGETTQTDSISPTPAPIPGAANNMGASPIPGAAPVPEAAPIPGAAPQNPYTSDPQYNAGATPVQPTPMPQNSYGQPSYGQNAYSNPYGSNYSSPSTTYNGGGEDIEDGKATGGLVCSLVSILCCGIILAPIGIILSATALRAGNKSSKASAGLIVGIISLVLNIVVLILACIFWYKLVEAAM